eukprot:CAMPEP_0116039414 /NCGR_PEP_ID=MMETSP0321-20121206/23546_1 /TAXON_ID=163516 /ORGANISM="Leptocylindrus danicus var. danicus, Strain B650" /LENGTH=597 /DNA_ID=CAMNT_0003518627 /DNA_START=1007 /DNA_END=2803 /DNA_ORIENTATION=-
MTSWLRRKRNSISRSNNFNGNSNNNNSNHNTQHQDGNMNNGEPSNHNSNSNNGMMNLVVDVSRSDADEVTELSSITCDYYNIRHHHYPDRLPLAGTAKPGKHHPLADMIRKNHNNSSSNKVKVNNNYAAANPMDANAVNVNVLQTVQSLTSATETIVSTPALPATASLIQCISARNWDMTMSRMAVNESLLHSSGCSEAKEWGMAPLLSPSQEQQVLPIHVACISKPPIEVMDWLLHAYLPGAAAQDPKEGKLPIHLALMRGASYDVIRALSEAYPAGLRTRDKENGRLPIHYACIWRDRAICQFLLQIYPAGVRAQDGSGSTPLELAQMSGNPKKRDVVELLREWDTSAVQQQQPPLSPPGDSSSMKQQHQRRTYHHNASVRRQEYAKSKSSSTNTNSSSASLYVSAVASTETRQHSYNHGDNAKINHHSMGTLPLIGSNNYNMGVSDENIDLLLSQLVQSRAKLISDDCVLSNNADKMRAVKSKSRCLHQQKDSLQKKIDSRKNKIAGRNTVIENTRREIESLMAIIAEEERKIKLESKSLDGDLQRLKDVESAEEELVHEMQSLEDEKVNIKESMNEKIRTLEGFDAELRRLAT